MSEPKTQCAACGVQILQRTADNYNGLCAPCHCKAAAIPPDDFQIAPDHVQRLLSIGEDPSEYRERAWQAGDSFVSTIEMLEDCYNRYHEWSPKLRQFAGKCREELPEPSDDSLDRRDRAKQHIYENKIKNADRLLQRRPTVTICRMPLLAIPVARRLWPGQDDSTILLTPEEHTRWGEAYSHPQYSLWWFVHYWWHIDDAPQLEISTGDLTLSKPHSLWRVTSGLQWGPLFGSCNTELWSWDGTDCKYISTMSQLVF